MAMKGYKVFNSDWTCRGFQYEVGKTYEMDEKPRICRQGFHFCKKLKDCFYYYPFNSNTKIAEVEMLGDSDADMINLTSKMCTNKIKILREIHFEDLMTLRELQRGYYRSFIPLSNDTVVKFFNTSHLKDGVIIIDNSIRVISSEQEICSPGWTYRGYHIFDAGYSYTYEVEFEALIDVKEKK